MTAAMLPAGVIALTRQPQPERRLFCFPYLAGDASLYQPWSTGMAAGIDVYGLDYPGHGTLSDLAPLTDLKELVERMGEALLPLLEDGSPYAFFGHSLGALIAFEVVRTLRRRAVTLPSHLIVAACTAPHERQEPPTIEGVEDLVNHLRSLGVPAVKQMIEPRLRLFQAGLALRASYRYRPEEPLSCTLVALEGSQDPSVMPMEEWCAQTAGKFALHSIPGTHFFMHGHVELLTGLLDRYLLSREGEY